MSKVDRNNPKRSTASECRYALFEFDQEFPDDAACLDFLMHGLYPDGVYCPKCERVTKHHREHSRPSYSCQFCGHREHPMKGTIFENSATSLRLWFYAMYLMASTRCGISAKQLERELGVTYKTAYRMFKQIRSLLSQEDAEPLNGTVELDEVKIGGEAKWKNQGRPLGQGRGTTGKQPVFGMARRKSSKKAKDGKIIATVVPDATAKTLLPKVRGKVDPKAMVYTDEWKSYDPLGRMGYQHASMQHSQKVYVSGDVHTNTIEGFWSLLQRGISGVSAKHLQSYLDEYTFRYNNRDAAGRGMFSAFLNRIRKKTDGEPEACPS